MPREPAPAQQGTPGVDSPSIKANEVLVNTLLAAANY